MTTDGSEQATLASSSLTKKGKTGISKAVDIHVSPDVLYRAVSTADGLRGWWAKNLTIEDGPEGILLMRWPSGHLARVRFQKGKAPSRAEWDVLEHRPFSEWNGTKLVFAIEKMDPRNSRLQFQHLGLTPECDCYDVCNGGWEYLMTSVKDYSERGRGAPK
jgi:uncharacterized protein YndB with AHSA1/START domain